jgi:hypothetical protein
VRLSRGQSWDSNYMGILSGLLKCMFIMTMHMELVSVPNTETGLSS